MGWYQQRWQIEQLFRTLKRQGLGLEASQLEEANELLKLACIATLAAARTLQLVNARDGQTQQLASDAFDDDELAVMAKLQDKLQGKSPKQKNPKAKPGPITLLHGLQRLDGMVQGWKLAKMWA